MVEFTLVAPLLFLLLFGIVDFGRAVFFQVELSNAAREGARVAILASNPCNVFVGNATGCTVQDPTIVGTTVCQGISQETGLISTFHNCTDGAAGAGTGNLPCSVTAGKTTCTGNDNEAYVEINQATTAGLACNTAVVRPSGYTTATPRTSGNKALQVKLIYFYRPLTPFLSTYFPTGFFLYATACARPEY